MIDRNSKNFEIDKIMLIYKYGSKKARKIAVDEKLKDDIGDIRMNFIDTLKEC